MTQTKKMPPRGSKRKGGSTGDDADPEHTGKRAKPNAVAVVRPTQNTRGLLSLPVELFDQIHNELLSTSRLITTEEVLANAPHLDDKFEYRTDVLRSLTQTCHALRVSCIPRYYEHVEACVVRGSRVWYKQLAERLEKTSMMLIESPHLAKHVQTVTVSLTRCSTLTVLPAFAACLRALPNLHTLRIMHAHSQMTSALKSAFESVELPQIRTIILPTCAHNILRSCPNIVDLTCNEDDGSQLISAMAKSSQNVEIVGRIRFWTEGSAKRLAKAAPKLRELHVSEVDKLEPFMKSKTLTKIRMTVTVQSMKEEDIPRDIETVMKARSVSFDGAKKVLASSAVKSGKTLEVVLNVRDFEKQASFGSHYWTHHYKVGKTLTYPL